MCHQPSHLLVTSHSSASRYCVVQHGACFVLYAPQLSHSACCFHYATKMHFLACHFHSQKCLLLSAALLHYFCLLLRPSRSRCNKFSAANRNQYSSAFTKPKAVSYFYHHTTPRAPTLQKTPSNWPAKNQTYSHHPINLTPPPS